MDSGEESTLREVGGDDVLDLLGVSDDDGNMDDFDEALLAEYEDGEDSTPGAADSAPVTSPAHDDAGGNTRAPHAEDVLERASAAGVACGDSAATACSCARLVPPWMCTCTPVCS